MPNGEQSRSEEFGRQEFILMCKQFEPAGPARFPLRAA